MHVFLLVRLVKAFSQFDICFFIFLLYEIGVYQLKQLVFVEHLRKAIRSSCLYPFVFKYFDVYKCLPIGSELITFQLISVRIKKKRCLAINKRIWQHEKSKDLYITKKYRWYVWAHAHKVMVKSEYKQRDSRTNCVVVIKWYGMMSSHSPGRTSQKNWIT